MDTNAPTIARLIPDKEREESAYRTLPHNIDAEQVVLGILLTNNEAINRVGDFLRPEHFYEPVHSRIFEAIQKFNDKGMVASPVTLKSHFDADEALEGLGGSAYLATLAGLNSGVLNIKDFAHSVYELAQKRDLIDIGGEMVDTAYKPDLDLSAGDLIEQAEHKLFNLASVGEGESGFTALNTHLTASIERANMAFKHKDKISGVPTDLADLDRLLGGLQDSDLVILAARPSMGKTSLAMNMALNAGKFFAKQAEAEPENPQKSVGFLSLEMSGEQLATRLLSMETGISSNDIRRGRLPHADDFAKLVDANRALHTLPLYIDDTPAQSISAVRTRARRMKRKHNLSLLVVDYLQLIRGVGRAGMDNRVQEVSEITQGLKAIAKELDIPVLALSQLSRAVESREDKRPQLADLRESGSIEQDADLVMFIYREEYYIERKKPNENDHEKMARWQEEMEKVLNVAEIMVAKHRNGPIGNVFLHFDSRTTHFGNLDRQHNDFM